MEGQLNLRRYLALFRRWLWLIIGCAAVAAVSAYAISAQMTPVYRSTTTLLLSQATLTSGTDYAAVILAEKLAKTYVEMLTSRPVLESVRDQLGLAELNEESISADLVVGTQMIELSVEDTDPIRAAQVADGIARAFIAQNQALQQERYTESLASVQEELGNLAVLIEDTEAAIDAFGPPQGTEEQEELARLQTILAGYRNTYATLLQNYELMRLTAAQSVDSIIIFEEAQVPEKPVRPRKLTNTALAGAVGAMLAVGVAFLVEYLDDTIKDPDDVTRTLGLGTLGVIGQVKKNGEGELVTVSQPLSPVSEAFRVLRTNIRYSGVDKPLRTLLVTSAGPTEGKSVTVANLGVAMAQAGLRVVVIDADLRRPRLHEVFGVHPRGGLTGSLLEGAMDGRLQPSGILEKLTLLPAGDLPPNPAEMLSSQRFQELLATLAQDQDMVLIDSPPILPVTDAAVLARGVDGVLLVIDAGETRREVARRAVDNLQQVGAHLIGAVLNRVPTARGGYYHYYQGYYDDGRKGRNGRKRRRGRDRAAEAAVSQGSKEAG
jgi:capsular exopolysaccharide synthesis family protein